ncbi:MAG: M28 family peptidase [Calditrichaeota bacterium]|nr:MAG: M28 family peptidase [Calditrichota bacterium]
MKRGLMGTLFVVFLIACGNGQGQSQAGSPETTSPTFDGQRAMAYLKKQVAFGPRNPGSSGHRNCKNYLLETLRSFTSHVEEQSFIYYDNIGRKSLTLSNLIARFSPELEPRILLCAHWDTRPFADQDPDPKNRDKPILGANDGASGVAVLLQLAELLSRFPPPIGVDLVFFDGEDYGPAGRLDQYFLGSRHFVQVNHTFYPQFAILLDMVGDAQLQLPIEGYSHQMAPQVVDRVWNLALEMEKGAFEYRINGYINDDHVILNQAGIPAIDIIDFAYPDESNRYWHTLEDTPDKCSPASLQTVGDVLVALIYRFNP